ncbi:MAG: hypothetical protein H6709_19315 [Kofleriaceae bacterium]|nr:hypothetical protein [Myxococcales bacterium]MCB9559463.1 hypothetical protein [Kofleriaceae bacterium]MCB9574241.1 hypothetical protein [Kofleriaceae bacterium]
MPVLPCNPGPCSWGGPHGGSFWPRGKLRHQGALPSSTAPIPDAPLAARLFVGLGDGREPARSTDDLVQIVVRVWAAQVGEPSPSLVAQEGMYQHGDPSRGRVVEPGAQIILINTSDLSARDFEQQVVQLAEAVAADLAQPMVIVELQRSGIMQKMIGVAPTRPA